MPDIFHDFTIAARRGAVFDAITTPRGLDEWWTKTSTGESRAGAIYELKFGPGFDGTHASPHQRLVDSRWSKQRCSSPTSKCGSSGV